MTNEERIKADAEAYANNKYGEYASNINDFEYPAWEDCVTIYIAGATAEYDRAQGELKEAQDAARMFCNKHNETATQLAEVVDRAQVLVDALEEAKSALGWYEDDAAIDYIDKALEQWKNGKEVGDE